ncbi:VOC family protein [Microtetraspora glauca]|uniref:VOC family protein n=1 Tax=Microtetraspora glauca TaxID=1996 RepID=A0ABV3GS03_MICGL
MIGHLQCVVLDCPEPLALAGFYRSLLGGEVNRPDPRWVLDDDWATLHTGSGMVLAFQRVPEYRPPRWPDPAFPQQFHLDIDVADVDRAHEQVVALGAASLDPGDLDPGETLDWRVYADPAGHPFCLVRG